MIWQAEWKTISARIEGINASSSPLIEAFKRRNEDGTGSSGLLMQNIDSMKNDLQAFISRHRPVLPSGAIMVIEAYCKSPSPNYIPGDPLANLTSRLMRILAVRSEVEYHLTDFEALIQRRSERAFLHLKQCIIAASDVRKQWQTAYDDGERACEKLGAAHLLLHGIYAFKVTGSQAETDLVFNDRIEPAEVGQVADALVLTEWKKVEDSAEAINQAERARKQAESYRSGVLGGIELTTYRYIVLVSWHQLNVIPDDLIENGVKYRHVNIAVEPLTPSKAAKRR